MSELAKILVVDDDEDIGSLTKMSLESIGNYEVQYCNSGVKALEILNNERPDLVLLDYMMPEMDGAETYEKIKANESLKDLPVIYLTAKVQKHEVEKFLASGVIGVIAKPYDPMTLSDEITDCWKNR